MFKQMLRNTLFPYFTGMLVNKHNFIYVTKYCFQRLKGKKEGVSTQAGIFSPTDKVRRFLVHKNI